MNGELTVGIGLFTGQRPAGATTPPYADAPVLAATAEEAGFDAFWVSEHHGWDDDYLPAPLTVLAAAAAVTDHIALGCGVLLAPLHHPVALAEQSAVVDHLSGGRLVLGMGLGYVNDEFAMFGVSRHGRGARLEKLLTFLRSAWRGEVATWHDEDGRAHTARVTPTPLHGHVPVWLGGYAEAALERAGRLADGYLIGRGDPAAIEAATAVLARHRAAGDPGFTFGANVLVIPDGDDAARSAFVHQQLAYERRQRHDDPFAGRFRVGDGADSLALGNVDAYLHAAGPLDTIADQVLDRLAPLRRHARVHVVLRALFPEDDRQLQQDRIRRFGDAVLPALRRAWEESAD